MAKNHIRLKILMQIYKEDAVLRVNEKQLLKMQISLDKMILYNLDHYGANREN